MSIIQIKKINIWIPISEEPNLKAMDLIITNIETLIICYTVGEMK